MAKLFFGMNQSLDGYVDFDKFGPSPGLFRHFIEQTRSLTGSIYGPRLYELMRYWDDDQESFDDDRRAFAQAWRKNRKWVASRSLTSVGPNAEQLGEDLEAEVRQIKQEVEGDIEVGGPKLAQALTEFGLIDEYRIYLHPVVLGGGEPFFVRARPTLRLVDTQRFDGDVIMLRYVPA